MTEIESIIFQFYRILKIGKTGIDTLNIKFALELLVIKYRIIL